MRKILLNRFLQSAVFSTAATSLLLGTITTYRNYNLETVIYPISQILPVGKCDPIDPSSANYVVNAIFSNAGNSLEKKNN